MTEVKSTLTQVDVDKAVKASTEKLKREHAGTVREFRKKVADAENRSKLAVADAEKLRKENQKLRAAVKPLQGSLSQNGKTLVETEKKVERLSADLEKTRKEKDAAQRRFAQLENSVGLMQKARDAAQSERATNLAALAEAEGRLGTAQGEVKDLRAKVAELERLLKDAKITTAKKD